ncbi:MAG: hypothetical protein OXP73_13995 [Chloroflexota bacterium]|nr:hypothetical protein [Chloroflexota bacterium]
MASKRDRPDTGRPLLLKLRDAALLAPAPYREAATTGGGNRAAITVVLTAALGFGIATCLGSLLAGSPITGLLVGIILEPLVTLIAWIGGSALAWAIGARLATGGNRPRGFWPVARALAFAQAPNLLGVLVALPTPYRGGVWFIARMCLLLATSTALREALGLSGKRTVVTLLFGAAAYAALLVGSFRLLAVFGISDVTSLSGGLGW